MPLAQQPRGEHLLQCGGRRASDLGEAKARTQDHPPSLVKLYREKARGVDRMDQNIAKYKVKIRAMKWYLSFISYIIDAALNSAWQLHRVLSGHTRGPPRPEQERDPRVSGEQCRHFLTGWVELEGGD